MDGKLCPGIQPPSPPLKFPPPLSGKAPSLIQQFFNSPPPFLKFWLESQRPLKGGGGAHYERYKDFPVTGRY